MRRDRRNPSFVRSPLRIVLIYALLGGGWILFSDLLVAKLFPAAPFSAVSIVKGWLFVAVTSLVLALLLRRHHAARVRLEQRNREIIDNLPSLLYAFDREGRLVLINRALSQLSGVAPDQALGQDRVALGVTPSDAAEHRANDLHVFTTGQPLLMEERNRQPDGLHTYLTVKFPLTAVDGTIEAVCGISTDITERTQAETARLASEERFRRAVVSSPFPIMLHAEDGAVLQLSDSWCEISGFTREELTTTRAWAERAYGMKHPQVEADIEALYGLERRKYEGDYLISTQDGTTRTWEFSSAPLGRLPDGRRLVISMAMDVSERRQAEEAIQEQLHELQRWEKVMLDREDRVQEIKREVNDLCRRLKEPIRYPSQEADASKTDRRTADNR